MVTLTDALNRATGFANRVVGLKTLCDTVRILIGLGAVAELDTVFVSQNHAGDGSDTRVAVAGNAITGHPARPR
jgi:hypothetical protein